MIQTNFRNLSSTGDGADLLVTHHAGDAILNFGRLQTSGARADGVYAEAADVRVVNSGQITTAGAGAAGMKVKGDHTELTNVGDIHTHGDSLDVDDDPDNGNSIFPDGMTVTGDFARLDNLGWLCQANVHRRVIRLA